MRCFDFGLKIYLEITNPNHEEVVLEIPSFAEDSKSNSDLNPLVYLNSQLRMSFLIIFELRDITDFLNFYEFKNELIHNLVRKIAYGMD